jgi:hypothetical protein
VALLPNPGTSKSRRMPLPKQSRHLFRLVFGSRQANKAPPQDNRSRFGPEASCRASREGQPTPR